MRFIYDMLVMSTDRFGGRRALICDNSSITYAGLLRMVDDRASEISDDVRAVTLPLSTNIDGVVALLACAKKRICILPLAHDMHPELQRKLTEVAFESMPDELPYLLLQTSGTTGDPKLIMLSQLTKHLRAQQFADHYRISPQDVILVGTALHFSMAQRLVFTSLMQGAAARLLDGYSPERWLSEALQCTVVVGLPHQLRHLEGSLTPNLRMVLNASATRVQYDDARYCDCWGTSEIAIATSLWAGGAEADDVGRAMPGVDVRISEEGEIEVGTSCLFDGYYKRPELTALAMTADGYFRTGDAGTLDERGHLHLRGRLNDVIMVGGTKVYPDKVEAIVGRISGVRECAAVAERDEILGERVHLAVVVDPDADDLTLRHVQHACVGLLTSAEMPRSLSFVNVLPRTSNGKLLRRALRRALR
jgi:long-chain acyl-CoA synthetase